MGVGEEVFEGAVRRNGQFYGEEEQGLEEGDESGGGGGGGLGRGRGPVEGVALLVILGFLLLELVILQRGMSGEGRELVGYASLQFGSLLFPRKGLSLGHVCEGGECVGEG